MSTPVDRKGEPELGLLPAASARWSALHGAALTLLEAEPRRALELAREAFQLAEESADQANSASSEHLLGRALMVSGDLTAALETLRSAAIAFSGLDDSLGQASCEELAGKVCLNLGRLEEAKRFLQSALSKTDRQPSVQAQGIRATALNHLAGVQHIQGASADALINLRLALDIWIDQKTIAVRLIA